MPIGGIVPGAVRAKLLGRAVVHLPTQCSKYTPLKIIKGTHVRNVISGLPYMLHFTHAVW